MEFNSGFKGLRHSYMSAFYSGEKAKCTLVQALRLCTGLRPIGGVEVWLYPFLTTALEGGEGSTSRPGRSLPPGKTRYSLYRRLRWPQGRSGRAENLAPTRIRSPDRPARSSVAIPTELPGPKSHNVGVSKYTP